MKKSPETEEINAEVANDTSPKPRLRVITGGRDGGGGTDWLSKIAMGTYFLARPKKNPEGTPYTGMALATFYAAGYCGKARIVTEENSQGDQRVMLVDSKRFSSIMELFDVLEDYQENNEQEDNSDDGRNHSSGHEQRPDDE